MGRPGHLQNEVMCGHEVGVGPNIHFPTSPSQVTHVTSKSGLESLTTFRPTSQILEAYSWSLHKLRREEMMVQRQGGDKAGYEEVDRERRWREREHVVLGLRITCSDASVTERVYFKYCDGIPNLI